MTWTLESLYEEKLYIICDTCFFFEDWYLNNEFWKKLKIVLHNHPNAKLVVTAPLKDEISKKITDTITKDIQGIEKSISKTKLQSLVEHISLKTLKAKQLEFLESYFDKIVKAETKNNVVFIDEYPAVTVRQVFKNSMEIAKPFKEVSQKGGYIKAANGFRDAIIWHSIEEFTSTKKGAVILFATKNTGDFANDDNDSIHEDFKKRLTDISFPLENFILVTEDSQFNDYIESVELLTDTITTLEHKLQYEIPLDNEAIDEALSNLDHFHEKFPKDAQDPVDLMDFEIEKIDIDHVYKDTDDTKLIEGRIEISYRYDFFLNHWDAHNEGSVKFNVEDPYWNKYCMLCSIESYDELHFVSTVEFDEDRELVQAHDIVINGTDIKKKT